MSPRVACLLACGAAVLLGGCGSSSPSKQATVPVVGATTTPPTTPPAAVPTTGGADASSYLRSVNALCDALLPRVIAVTHGGSLDVPVKDYLAQLPAHAKLLAGFDADVATVPVPAAAESAAAVLRAYVAFADKLDAARLAAARDGEPAYAKEVKSEANVGSDPAVTALSAAGFNQSCEAR